MYRRILIPLDGSELAEAAIPHARFLASVTGATVELLRVAVPRFVQTTDGSGFVVQEEGDRQEAEQYVQGWRERLVGEGVDATCQVRLGNVAEEISEYSASSQVDLIVMSTHGRTGTRLWAYGSVAHSVLKSAHCSVLLVRERRYRLPGDTEAVAPRLEAQHTTQEERRWRIRERN